MVFLSPTSPIAPDLEPGHQPPELPQLFQDEDVCHPWGHPHGLWGVPQHLQPHVSAESCQWEWAVSSWGQESSVTCLFPQALWPGTPALARDLA